MSLTLNIDEDNYDPDFNEDVEEDCDDEASQVYTVIQYTVPEWALPYLFNGDATGLDYSDSGDEDLAAIVSFLKSEGIDESKGHWSSSSGENETYFSHSNDITKLGDNVVDIEWVMLKE